MPIINFFLVNPWGETILLTLLGLYLWRQHRKGRVHGLVVAEIIGYLAITIIGFVIPGVFVFLLALVYVYRRMRRARREGQAR